MKECPLFEKKVAKRYGEFAVSAQVAGAGSASLISILALSNYAHMENSIKRQCSLGRALMTRESALLHTRALSSALRIAGF